MYIYICVCVYCEFLILVHVFVHLYVELKFWIGAMSMKGLIIYRGLRFRLSGFGFNVMFRRSCLGIRSRAPSPGFWTEG